MSTPEPAVDTEFLVLPGMAAPAEERRRRLREMLRPDQPAVLLPGAYDALSARLCERAGFGAVYLTGAGLSNTHLALPDVGLIGFPEMLEAASRMVEATTVPIIVDADNGYGGPVTVARAVALFETAGVAAIQLEDQGFPKRCGHFEGKSLISAEAMQAKIDAAVSARRDPNTVIIARTDARATEGFPEAMRRIQAYREAGADVLFLEAPETTEEIVAVPERFSDIPLLMNVVDGGRTPPMPTAQLDKIGYRLILHANYLLRSMAAAVDHALRLLQADQGELPERFLSWQDRQDLVGLAPMDNYVDGLRAKWNWTDE
jgi:2,3-dimethylmalate lyase